MGKKLLANYTKSFSGIVFRFSLHRFLRSPSSRRVRSNILYSFCLGVRMMDDIIGLGLKIYAIIIYFTDVYVSFN